MQPQVLLIEDVQDTIELITFMLWREGFVVRSVQTLDAARQARAETKFDLYLLDLGLPDGNGIELCREIRRDDSEVPIIFHTGRSDDESRREAMDAGATAFLVKPSQTLTLVNALRQLFAAER
jgi:DNA-binding response OmpR family regulator